MPESHEYACFARKTPSKPVHLLVDLENVQPAPSELDSIVPNYDAAWIFHGQMQLKLATHYTQVLGEKATLVPIHRSGNNSLDFHLSFYLGYVAARNPDAHLIVVANDKGYRPMIEHAPQKRRPAKATAPKAQSTGARPVDTKGEKGLRRLEKAFLKMGQERPEKVESFMKHVANIVGNNDDAVSLAVNYLGATGVATVIEDRVVYGPPGATA